MTTFVYLLIYAGVLAFFIGCLVRAIRYARMPLHLRWELYPVPHEEARRVRHGGSRYEEADWWKKPAHFNLAGELKFMVPEMLFLKGLWEFNRKLWFRSFPFHFGLYLVAGSIAMVLLGAALSIFAPNLAAGAAGIALHHLARLAWLAGSALAIVGAVGLLLRRIVNEELKPYTTPGDIFNLLFFIATFGLLFTGYLLGPPGTPGAIALVRGILTFETSRNIPGVLAGGLVLAALLIAYIPLTHMSHFIAKYFTYHAVRWDDRVNIKGGELEKKFAEYLTYRPTWAAAHVAADGKKTWAEVATANPAVAPPSRRPAGGRQDAGATT